MSGALMQCNEVVTPLGMVAVWVTFAVMCLVFGLALPWVAQFFAAYWAWVERRSRGGRS